MTYTELQNISYQSLKGILQFPSLDTPMFWPIILLVVFITMSLLTFFREVGRDGKGNMLSSLAVAGYLTTSLSLAFTFLDLIMYQVVITIFVISLVFQVLFMLTKKD